MNIRTISLPAANCFRVINCVVAIILLSVCLSTRALAQGSTDGTTPLGLTPGAPTGSHTLSDFDVVNLHNGTLNFRLPVFQIAGRGGAAYPITLQVNKKWTVYRHFEPGIGYFYYADGAWWSESGAAWFLDVGRVHIRTGYREQPTGFPVEGLTRVTFTAPDGTEYEFRDQLTNGQPKAPVSGGFNRGTVFVTADGTTATFISDWDIHETAYGMEPMPADGYVRLKDGTHFRVDDGFITWMRDRNGNKVTFGKDAFSRATTITDSLNRLVTITYPSTTTGFTQITFKGYGGSSRTIKVGQTNLSNALRSGYTMLTGSQLFPEMNGVWNLDAKVINYIELPDGRSYQLRYNPYGELARVVVPTGGAIEYDYAAGLTDGATSGAFSHSFPPTEKYVYRRVIERRVYPDGGSGSSFASKMTYSRPESSTTNLGYVITEQRNSSGTLLAKSRHYFHGSARASFLLRPTHYPAWKDGREYKTEQFHTDGSTILNRSERTFAQRAAVSWWGGTSDTAPPNDPRTIETVTTMEPATANLVTKRTFGFDDTVPFNNQNNVKEYDFGSGAAGSLLRETRTTFINSANYTSNTVHLRNLTSQVSIHDGGGTERARTTYEYDNYLTDPLVNRLNISGLDPAFDFNYTTRGNATATTRYLLVGGSVTGSVSSSAQYDIAGNVVKTIDPRGNPTTLVYTDCFGAPNGEAQTTTDPAELGVSTKTFAFVTELKNALNQSSFAQYDYYLGRVVDAKDLNGIVGSGYFNDSLDRPTEIRRAVGTAVENRSVFSYDDSNRIITTASDRDLNNDGLLLNKLLYDQMGRTIETRQYEGGTNYIARQSQYDALGRAFKISDPFRPWQGQTAVWTTQAFDALGRVTSVTTPDNAAVNTSYIGNTVTVTDAAGKARKSAADGLGRLIAVYEDPYGLNYQTTYLYDVLDNLVKVTQGTHQRYFMYDSLGRLIRAWNPEQATLASLNISDPLTGNNVWSLAYQYDANSNVTQKTDARGVVSTYAYDALNRNTTIDYSDTASLNPDVKWFYDGAVNGKGRFWYFYKGGDFSTGSNVDHKAVDSYDALGRPLVQRQLFKLNGTWGPTYQMSRGYNLEGAVTSQTYPSGHTVSYTYDVAGRTTSFSGNLGDGSNRSYASEIIYSSLGGISKEKFGTTTPLYNKLFYNNRGQLSEIRVGTTYTGPADTGWQRGAMINHYSSQCWGACTPTSSMTDNNGNLKQQDHFIPDAGGGVQAVFTQSFDYDSLNRLQRVREGSWQQEYVYDRWGNRTIHQTNTYGTGIPKPNFGVNTANNRLTAPAGFSMTYDAAGNLTTDTYTGAGFRTYDAENRMTTAADYTGQTSRYTYDADGRRVRRTVGSSQEQWQVYGFDGELLAEYAASGAAAAPQKEYAYRNGQLLIAAEAGGAGASSQNVTWTNAVGVSVAGNNLTKTAGDDWLNARASSTQALNSGNGYVEFTASETTTHRMLGLGEFGSGYYTYNNIRYAIYLAGSVLYTDEYGSLTNVGSYSTGDQLRVAVESGAVKYYKNGVLLRMSALAPTYPLYVNVAMYTNGSTLTGAVISDGSGSTGSIHWLVTDHLGTPRIILDQTGSLANVKRHDYLPFGEELYAGTGGRTAAHGYSVSDGVRQQFTQKERDTETGLDYFLARYYSSTQGRFTSVDPENAGADESDPQSWNGYAYARNNPTLYSDPDGRTFKICYQDGNCQDVTDEQFNQIKADATKLGSVFKNGTIYNEVDGQLVATATYQRTAFDDLNDQANAVIFGSNNGAGLVDRLRPVQQVVETGFAIDMAIISGGTSLGVVGGTTLGLRGGMAVAAGFTTKAAARAAVDSLVASPAAKAAAKKAIARATAKDTIEVVEEAGTIYVRAKRVGSDGHQVIESVIKNDGSKTVVQKAYDALGRLVHYDPKP